MRKARAKWLILERDIQLQPNFARRFPSVRDEIIHLEAQPSGFKCSASQLTFIASGSRPLTKRHQLRGTLNIREILATCIIIHCKSKQSFPAVDVEAPENFNYIFEAVVSEPTRESGAGRVPVLNTHIQIYSEAEVQIAGRPSSLHAAYFCQQNGLTTSCSQASLKMALWHVDPDPLLPRSQRIRQNYQIDTSAMNDAAKEVAEKNSQKFDPAGGLRWNEFLGVRDRFKFEIVETPFENGQNGDLSPYELAYLFVESGFPTLIFFRVAEADAGTEDSEYHVVPVIGHTMNSDEWLPFALRTYKHIPPAGLNAPHDTFLGSVEWVPHLVIHDDLIGPYLEIGPNSLTRKIFHGEKYYGRACRVAAIAPRDLGNDWSPLAAQDMGSLLFWSEWNRIAEEATSAMGAWYQRMLSRWSDHKRGAKELVLRTQLISLNKYIPHLAAAYSIAKADFMISSDVKKLLNDSAMVWLIEFSFPELFCTNRSKLGEIVMPFSFGQREMVKNAENGAAIQAPHLMRLLGAMKLYYRGKPTFSIGDGIHLNLFSRRQNDEVF